MNSSEFDVLTALFLSGEANEKQKTKLEEIINSSEEKRVAFEKLKKVWHIDLSKSHTSYLKQNEFLWTRLRSEIQIRKRKRKINFIYKAAAIILLAVSTSLSIYFYLDHFEGQREDKIARVQEVVKNTKPGERLKTRLPDGTMVYLNVGSQLRFPESFSDTARLVELIGEGYFDVYKDKSRPFTVRTQSMDITALGTEFGVNAYSDNIQDHVALVSGRLLIKNIKNQEVRIDSGQSVTLSRKDLVFQKSDIDYLAQVAWKDGVLYFNHNSFDDIVETLELNYGVRFTMDKQMNFIRGTYTGTFKNESLENILEVLSFSMDFKYKINDKEILVEKK